MRFADASHVQFSTDFDDLAAPLGIVGVLLIRDLVKLYLAVAATFTGSVILKSIQRILTCVKTFFAQISFIFPVLLADFVLEATALQVLIETLINFHF